MRIGNKASYLVQINIAMLCISTSGVLGRYVSLIPPVTIFWRSFLAGIVLLFYCVFRRIRLKIDIKKDGPSIGVGGLLLGAHWITYFYALQLSNVAIGIISMFTFPIITTLLEPILLKTKFQSIHLLLAVMVFIGIYLLVPEFDFNNRYVQAIGWGVLSAFLYSLRNIMMKRQAERYNGSALMCYQIIVVAMALLPLLSYSNFEEVQMQWGALVTLAVVTTAIGHTLFLMSFKYLSISSVSILSGVMPVYGIILGMIFLNEIPKGSTLVGGAFILAAVFIESYRTMKVKET